MPPKKHGYSQKSPPTWNHSNGQRKGKKPLSKPIKGINVLDVQSAYPVTPSTDLKGDITALLKCHIVKLDEHYLDVSSDPDLSDPARDIITGNLMVEIQHIGNTCDSMQASNIITFRQSLSCLVRLAEVKTNYLKNNTKEGI